jgi:hypothetical protein
MAAQSGGGVRIHSLPGRGTTVSIHLPRSTRAVERETAPGMVSARLTLEAQKRGP